MVMVLQIPALIYEEMVAHARRELPNECVGMLIGSRDGVVHEYLPLVNEHPSPTTFLTEPRSMLHAEKRCRALGLHVLGIFHSHPTGSNSASKRDLANHYSPDVLCLILAMEKEPPELAAWHMLPETFKRAEVIIKCSAADSVEDREWLNTILSQIVDGTLLRAAYYGQLDCDAALDARDGDTEFGAEWVHQFEDVGQRWAATAVAAEIREVAEVIRRVSFLAVSRVSRQHEIASYVSDDFDLIVRGRIVGMESVFLERLWAEYERGQFPHPRRTLHSGGEYSGVHQPRRDNF